MRTFLMWLCIGILAPGNPASARTHAEPQAPGAAPTETQVAFGALKSLAGTWTGTVKTDPPNPDLDGPIQVTMRVASRGNLLVHEIAPGGMPEPTMIYVDGDRLTLVHYCEAGNRPRLVASKPAGGKTTEFAFADISGSKSPVYLHDFVFTVLDANHHAEDWTFMLPGEKLLHARFDLTRAP